MYKPWLQQPPQPQTTDGGNVAIPYSSPPSNISYPSYTRATICGLSIPRLICARPCLFNTPSGPRLQTETPSMGATTMLSIVALASI